MHPAGHLTFGSYDRLAKWPVPGGCSLLSQSSLGLLWTSSSLIPRGAVPNPSSLAGRWLPCRSLVHACFGHVRSPRCRSPTSPRSAPSGALRGPTTSSSWQDGRHAMLSYGIETLTRCGEDRRYPKKSPTPPTPSARAPSKSAAPDWPASSGRSDMSAFSESPSSPGRPTWT